MRRRFYRVKVLMLTPVAAIIGGCAMIDHSNTLVFGTNTNVGLQVGADANNVPSINVGYRRQEAAFLPLLANHKDAAGKLIPCTGPALAPNTQCKFLAKNGQSQAEDAYSVLASFGAEFSAKSGGTPEAGGGLAQYFATGAAAQMLAVKGGAALVAVGPAAEKSAQQPSQSALVALVAGTDVKASMDELSQQRIELADYLQGLTDADFVKEADRLSGLALNDSTFLREKYCAKVARAECVAKIRATQFNEYAKDFYKAYKGS